MKVLVNKKLYQMSKAEFNRLLGVASEQVPFGIYAIEKREYAELRCDKCDSITQLKKLISAFKKQGYKVYSNGKRV